MATQIDICNMSLGHLGISKSIASISEASSEARALNKFWTIAVQDTLKDAYWPFATTIATLALVAQNPTTEWDYSYTYPSDCLAIHRIVSDLRTDTRQTRVPYRVVYGPSSRLIYTDRDQAVLEYTVDVQDPSRFTSDFAIAVSYRLAMYAANALTAGDPFKLGQAAAQMYIAEITKAQANAANEEQPDQEPDSEFIRARNYGRSLFDPLINTSGE